MKAQISVDRSDPGSVHVAVFSEGFDLLRNFETFPSQNEQIGIELTRKWCSNNGHEVVKVIYPQISRSKIWKTKRKK